MEPLGSDGDSPGLTIPYESDTDDDGDFSHVHDEHFLESGWGGECLQDTEDIDFEFVYALHTFVATVEGQANATKGDTMVLLDDSNSYWWLVRVVKDSSIGYLPAEHIETPTERLARLNKHRNIDLSATMLGDQADKPRNAIMSAMKRTKRKTVQFAAPTYVDYSDIDYSTEEEDLEAEYFGQQQQAQKTQQSNVQQIEPDTDPEDETAKVEPLKPRPLQTKDSKTSEDSVGRPNSEEIFESKPSEGPKKSSDGNVRDSFFKDDVETKKITLTPNLLRDDSGTRTSSDSVQLKQRPSLDKLEKDSPTNKDDKKRKEKENSKKPSAIRSFFSRKDKRKGHEDDEAHGKSSQDADGHEREHEEDERNILSSPERAPAPQRNPSKLQKSQPTNAKPIAGILKDTSMDAPNYMSAGRINNKEARKSKEGKGEQSPETSRKQESVGQSRDAGAQQITQAQPRSEMDLDSDEDDNTSSVQHPPAMAQEPQRQQERSAPSSRNPFAAAQPAASSVAPSHQHHVERLSESPVHVSPIQADHRTSPTPPLMADSSSQEDRSSERLTPSPELVEHDDDGADDKDIAPPSPISASTPTWNDASLRAFFDSGSEIRDMLVVVYDKSDVEPVGPDHPIAGSLFKEQNAKLAEITTQLDNMLGDWLSRKQRLRGVV
ncbi:unnamed protein product [Sordaria macrospora k-hell]|uniref:WGS project CABT00000000 data, contig 2.1 n=1 Tax=Sordaria macrospora (strain ATCC MYA-333 / DSM 997 / K(L3346) / K-hell) TaxID=771870 RepID=F7VK57_SORMK|nr:uncharacterized protein SMAC_00099 [Sordaria macrospora k-hell]CCC05884.1 unnamed protein product [Sordaria macrospora k-hell]